MFVWAMNKNIIEDENVFNRYVFNIKNSVVYITYIHNIEWICKYVWLRDFNISHSQDMVNTLQMTIVVFQVIM